MNSIDLSWYNHKTKDIHTLLKDCQEKESITSINLEGNFIEVKGLYHLFQYISFNFKNIIHLNLSHTNITIQEFYIISKQLVSFQYLNSLYLDSNQIVGKSIRYLNPILPRLKELSINSNFISFHGISYLCNEFKNMKRLTYLSINNCNLYCDGIYILSEHISHLENLEYLSLSGNYCNISVFSYLLFQLPKKNMIFLDLGNICSHLETDNGIYQSKLHYTSFFSSQLELFKNLNVLIWNMYYDTHIMYGIGKLKKLNKLILDIDPIFFDITISYFPYLPSLEFLKISSIEYKSFIKIIENLPIKIKHLYFKYIFPNLKIINILCLALLQYKNLYSFSFTNSSLQYRYLEKICHSLKKLKYLYYLSFFSNLIEDESINLFLPLLRLKNLKYLSLQENSITFLGLQKIIDSLKNRENKMSIYINNNLLFRENYNIFSKEIKELLDINYLLNYKWINEIKDDFVKIMKYKPFYHSIDFFYKETNDIEKYNNILLKIQKRMEEKKSYYLFYSEIEKTNHYHEIFYNKDIKTYIQEFL